VRNTLLASFGVTTSHFHRLNQGSLKMNLQIHPLEIHDFDTLISQADQYPPGADLTGLPTPLCCEVTTQEQARVRLQFHFDKQKTRYQNDPTVHYMKVIDIADQNSIIGVARWHFYPKGYEFETESHWEVYDLTPDQLLAPREFNIALYNHIITTRDAARASWIPKKLPCWILMHMVTHPAHRRKGAAGLIMKWGVEKADSSQVPAYLEAGVMGKPIYERYAFVQTGDPLEVDLRTYGVDMGISMCKMVYWPQNIDKSK
jgi:GNAT superfamily N-acetyltransferase